MQTSTPATIATDLSTARRQLTTARVGLADVQFRLAEAEAETLCGVEYAALGKNEGERKLALERLLRDNATWLALHHAVHEAKMRVLELEGEVSAIEDQRRGEEWAIRAALAEGSDPLTTEHTPGSDKEAFDDRLTEHATRKVVQYRQRPAARVLHDVAPPEPLPTVDELWPSSEFPF